MVHNGIITNYKEVKLQKLFLIKPLNNFKTYDVKSNCSDNNILSYFQVKMFLQAKGHKFESDTDTEVISKLIKHLHDKYPGDSFRRLVEKAVQQLEGAFACCFKSSAFPGQLVATRRGSPLLVGIKTEAVLESDSIPVQYRYNNPSIYISQLS